MSLEENKAVVQRLFEASNTRNPDILDEVIAEDLINHNPDPGDPQDAKQAYTRFVAAFPDVQVAIEDIVAEGDKVMVRLTTRGTHQGEFVGIPPTGKQITMTGMEVVRIANGKIVERCANFDQLSFYQQLGVIQWLNLGLNDKSRMTGDCASWYALRGPVGAAAQAGAEVLDISHGSAAHSVGQQPSGTGLTVVFGVFHFLCTLNSNR